MRKFVLIFASLSMAVAVGMGAFGAHALKAIVTVSRLETFQTASTYQMVHSLGLLFIGLMMYQVDKRFLKIPAILMILGILLFSGSLYALVLSEKTWLGFITPFGGMAFITAWLLLAYVMWKKL